MGASRARISAGMLAAVLVAASGCANDTGDSGGEDKGDVNLSGQNFIETQITAAMYSLLLEDAGYNVTTKLVDTRDVYIPEMKKGDVDVATEYVGALADYLNTTANGDDAEPVSSSDLDETMANLEELAAESNITVLEPAEAVDANAFAVTSEFAEENDLSTLSDLAALGEPIVLAAAPDCEGRPDCEGGLSDDYGIDITKVLGLGYASPQAIESVKSGESQLVEVASTQSDSLAEQGLVVLEDDKQIQPVQNLVPVVNSDFLNDNPEVEDILNKVSAELTSDDIAALNAQVAVDRADPAQVAEDYLTEKGLLPAHGGRHTFIGGGLPKVPSREGSRLTVLAAGCWTHDAAFIRSGKGPLTPVSAEATLAQDIFHGNVGNHLYTHAVHKTLLTPGTKIVSNGTLSEVRRATADDCARANEKFDAFVIPLANAFRPQFRDRLENLTAFVKGLTIPVVVVGVGVQIDGFDQDLAVLEGLAPDVRAFVSPRFSTGRPPSACAAS